MKKSSSGRSTPTSREFAEQIKQLELEGKRLMDATNHLGGEMCAKSCHFASLKYM